MIGLRATGSCGTAPDSEAAVTGRLLYIVSELPLLTCRRCEDRWVPRRGVEGGIIDIESREPLGAANVAKSWLMKEVHWRRGAREAISKSQLLPVLPPPRTHQNRQRLGSGIHRKKCLARKSSSFQRLESFTSPQRMNIHRLCTINGI